jgi:uncharacterized repeat protein (TIGR01451 family)
MKNKRRKKLKFERLAVAALTGVVLAIMLAAPAMAADNIGVGDIGVNGAALNDSNTFSLFSTTMSLNKMAFLSNGTQLTSGDTVPRGTEVRFVIYVDNTTDFPMNDVSIQDVLDPAFVYQAGSMLVENTIPSGSSQAVIYSTVNNGGAPVSDAPGDDVASVTGATIDVGNSVVGTNAQLDAAANSVWAILFRVLMQ